MDIPLTDARGFASDNHSGVHPTVLQAMQRVNRGHLPSYGADPVTARAKELFREQLGAAEVFFVFNGTGANVLSLRALTRSYNAVLCAATSHLQVDECGAPELLTGCKVLPVPSHEGKLTPDDVEPFLIRRGDQHHAQPKVLSISQATEYGTVYCAEEVRSLAAIAHAHDLFLHMDGARLANAAASLGVSEHLGAVAGELGVDVLSFGGTKNGLMLAEAVVFFDRKLADNFDFLRKESMQLCSKMRFVAAQFIALLSDHLWLDNARHANAMASLLAAKAGSLPFVEITRPVQANAVFAKIPEPLIQPLMERFPFYVWDEKTRELRWMTSFDSQPEDVDAFAAALAELAANLL